MCIQLEKKQTKLLKSISKGVFYVFMSPVLRQVRDAVPLWTQTSVAQMAQYRTRTVSYDM